MKKIIFPCFILAYCLFANISFGDTISMQDALEKNIIIVTAKSTGYHIGQCIIFITQNKTTENFIIHLEAGRFMNPNDTTKQRMVITKEQYKHSAKFIRHIKNICNVHANE